MFASTRARLKALLFRRASDAELDEELAYHLMRETERNVANGMTPAAARDAARRAFGNVTAATEQARDASRWRAIEELMQDVAFAAHCFRRAPMFVAGVTATIGVGLGLMATAFTLFNSYVLRPLAVRDPYALYDITWRSRDGQWHPFTWQGYTAIRAERGVLTDAFAFVNQEARINGQPMMGQLVTPNYFDFLGVPPAFGRTLTSADESAPGSGAVVVLSHRTWRASFGSDSAVIGSTIRLNGVPLRIIGVAADGFGGLSEVPFDFWVPLSMLPAIDSTRDVFGPKPPEALRVVGRLKPGVTLEQLRGAVARRVDAMTSDLATTRRLREVLLNRRATPIPLTPELLAVTAPLAVAFALVMLIACANVANMMLARGMARQREIGIRLALGADRARLIRQLLTEAVVLSVPAAALGYLVSRATLVLGMSVMFATVPRAFAPYLRVIPLQADTHVLLFMGAAAVVSALAFGLVPALQATKPSIVQASRGDFDTQFRPSRLRNALVLSQITVSVVLIICAGVLLRGARKTERLQTGLRTENIVQIAPVDRARARVVERLRTAPLAVALAGASNPPLDGGLPHVLVSNGARPAESIDCNLVSPSYFAVLDVPIVRGRNFTDGEAAARSPVVIVSQGAADHFWPGQDPIGRTLSQPPTAYAGTKMSLYHAARVIGVSANVTPGWIGRAQSEPLLYYPQPIDSSSNVLVRVRGDAAAALVRLDRDIAAVDSGAVTEMHTLADARAVQVYPFLAAYWCASMLGGIALLLTITGVYAVLAYLVAQRRKELGVRMALGATPPMLIAMVLGQSLRLAMVGVGAGALLALGASRVFASVVFIVDPFDIPGYIGGVGLVLVACVAAAYVPSRRAATVDPVQSLRADS